MKQDIDPVEGILEHLLALEPVTYRYKARNDDADRTYGFIAQDVEEVFPKAVVS